MPPATQKAVVISNADDTNVSQVIQKPQYALHLQIDLDVIYKWALKGGMQLIAEKLRTIHDQQTYHSNKLEVKVL